VIPVHPGLWSWIDAAVPSPLGELQLRRYWHRACLKEGLATLVPDPTGRISPKTKKVRLRYKGPRLHDLRHCNGQWATNAGAGVDGAGVSLPRGPGDDAPLHHAADSERGG
jgi:hypothetical protein